MREKGRGDEHEPALLPYQAFGEAADPAAPDGLACFLADARGRCLCGCCEGQLAAPARRKGVILRKIKQLGWFWILYVTTILAAYFALILWFIELFRRG